MATLTYRPLRAGERAPVLEVFAGLSERSRRLRFLGSKPRLLERDLAQLVDVGSSGREAVAAIRQVRSEYAIAPNKSVEVAIRPATPRAQALLGAESQTVSRLARATLTLVGHQESSGAAPVLLSDGSELLVSLAGVVDLEKECARVRGELSALEKQLAALEQRLGNEGFVSRAPAHVVQAERQKLGEWTARRTQLASRVQSLCG